jgi:hypothetical protein
MLSTRLYPLEAPLKAERQVDKLVPTLVPKEGKKADSACHSDAMDCTICATDVQAGVGTRPGADCGSATGTGQTDRDGGVARAGARAGPPFRHIPEC